MDGTQFRITQESKRLFDQFYQLYVFGIIFKTALDNPVGYGLLDQSQMCFGEESATFLSNLSLLGDLLYSCCDTAYWNGLYEQFESTDASKLTQRGESI